MPGRYAVVIGINYRNFPATMVEEAQSRAGINALNYAEADAEEMAKLLEADGYDVVKLIGPTASRNNIIDALRDQSRKAGSEGLLLVHYSGHGAMDPDDHELAYLLPADADPEEMASDAIPLDSVARYYLGRTQSALVILDCCHSGYAVGLKSADKDVALNSAAQEFSQQAGQTFKRVLGRVTIAACAGQQLARERADLGHGVLTHYVLKHWRESSETVDDFSMYRYLAKQMPTQGVPAPVRGGTPQQGMIELRPARPVDVSPTPAAAPVSDRATLFKLLLGSVQTPDDLVDLAFLVKLKYESDSKETDLKGMIRSFVDQAEAAGRIPDLLNILAQPVTPQPVAPQEPKLLPKLLGGPSYRPYWITWGIGMVPFSLFNQSLAGVWSICILLAASLRYVGEIVRHSTDRTASAGANGNNKPPISPNQLRTTGLWIIIAWVILIAGLFVFRIFP
ncbi:MAG TPA: caspase family protein [Chloroflexia bacterium]|nr:caspase family protein [Chloroflexia bacterium]